MIDLTDAELANAIKGAAGEPPVRRQAGAAERWVIKALDLLPARLVDAVIAEIDRKAEQSRYERRSRSIHPPGYHWSPASTP